MKKTTTREQKVDSEKEKKRKQEIAEMFANSELIKGEQLVISEFGELKTEKAIKQFALGTTENPSRKYKLYYLGIQKIMMKYLPSGEKNKKFRNLIYEEKNVYLTRGKRKNKFGVRGADSRMGFMTDAQQVFNIVLKWASSENSPVELYASLSDLNAQSGYSK